MNQGISQNQRVLKCKNAIITLSLIAIVFAVLNSLVYFVYYGEGYWDGRYHSGIQFRTPSTISLIYVILSIAPKVLLPIYASFFFEKRKATFMVPVMFGSIAAAALLSLVNGFMVSYGLNFYNLVINFVTMITFTLATVSAFKGLSNKVFIIIPTVLGLACSVVSMISVYYSIGFHLENELYVFILTGIAGIIASVTFNIALLLFGVRNKIPIILSKSFEKIDMELMSPEQALRLLQDKLDRGTITEEEYQSQRAEIISKL